MWEPSSSLEEPVPRSHCPAYLRFIMSRNRVPHSGNRFPSSIFQIFITLHIGNPGSVLREPVPTCFFFENSEFFSFFKRYLFIFYSCILPYKITICKGVLEAIYFRFFRIYFLPLSFK